MKYCPVCKNCYEDAEERCSKEGFYLLEAFPGERIVDGKYRIDALIGQGGMGTVYRATHLELDRVIALKVVLPDFVSSSETLERFRREARAAARLNHPNVITIYDFGVLQSGRAYLAMELLTGRSLREEIEKHGYLSPERVLQLLKPVCEAVQAAHNAGVIHRDLKPDNIVIEVNEFGTETVKVVDFGIAKLKETSGQKLNSLTGPGLVMGTPHYMSPEQCKGEDLDPRSDVYSLGVMLYEMLCGQVPFDAPTPSAVIIQHAIDPPQRLSLRRKDIPPKVEEVVMKALSKSRHARQQTVRQLYEELHSAVHSESKLVGGVDVDKVMQRQNTSLMTPSPSQSVGDGQRTLPDGLNRVPSELDSEAELLRRLQSGQVAELVLAGELLGHEHVIRAMCYVPGRQRMVSGSSDGVIKIWDLQKMQAIGTLLGHELAVNSLAVSPDGLIVVSASSDGSLRLWSLQKEAELKKLHEYTGALRAVAFSPKGRFVAVANEDNIDLWEVDSAKQLAQFAGHAKLVEDVEFSKDGQLIVSGGVDGTIRFWSVATASEVGVISCLEHCVNVISTSVDYILATGGKEGEIILWDMATRAQLTVLKGHEGAIRALDFSPTGDYLISGDWEGVVKVWDTATGELLVSVEAHEGAVMAAVFSPSEEQVATGGYDQVIKVWDFRHLLEEF
ncbi:MAG: serine/threonine-protein kinase [Acidobacteriota bacterium]|nr:serine/threonine protein kinase [Blastocatellia bacterium]MDW8411180.1 serine/threonine-protein kinase [Acidobacteriota bacterium]